MKWKAFTILEMLTVMVISGIVFVIISSTLLFFERLTEKTSHDNDALFQFQRLDALIQQDFFNADHIISSENQMIFKETGRDIRYLFMDTLVIRQQEMSTDTFNVTPIEKEMEFEAQTLLVSGLKINYLLYSDTITCNYEKWYDRSTIFRHIKE